MRRAHRDHPTVIDDANPVRILGLRKLVCGQADRDVELRSQLPDVLPKVAPTGGIEAAGGLVEEQDLRVMHEPTDDLELPTHAARQSPDRLENLGAETDYIGELSDLAPIGGWHQAVHRAVWVQQVKDGVESDVLLAVEVHIQGRVLKDDSDLAPHLARLTNDVVSRDLDRAGSQAEGCREDRDRGRLPSSIGTEEGEELPLLHLEADTIDGVRTALSIPLHQVSNLNRGRHIFRPSISVRHARPLMPRPPRQTIGLRETARHHIGDFVLDRSSEGARRAGPCPTRAPTHREDRIESQLGSSKQRETLGAIE